MLSMVYTYDGTFEGLLTAIFECYSRKEQPADIAPEKGWQGDMFAKKHEVLSNAKKADRVWNGAQKKLSARNSHLLFHAFLSEETGIEMKIYRFLRRLFEENINIETDFGDPDVLSITQTSQKVKKEAMRMLQFARFQHTTNGLYFCGTEPIYDVIPLAVGQLRKRFADQYWLVYDLKRNYGVLYNGDKLEEVAISHKEFNSMNGKVNENVLGERETFYQELWRSYYTNINIKERKNLRLQRQHMPKRFWKYLPEKQ